MTLAELNRALRAKKKMIEYNEQRQATFDYILADLIGRSISRVYSSSAKMPEIAQVYPTLFDSEEIMAQKQEQKAKLSAIRFKHFTESFNNKLRGVKDSNG